MNWRIGILVAALVGAHGSITAMAPPSVIYDDKLDLGVPITAITLDSTHFAERTLLVGTDTSADGQSFVVQVSGLPLQITDTVAVFESRVRVIRAAMLDADSIPDWLVGLDSNVVRILGGPGGPADTIPLFVERVVTIFPDTIPGDTFLVAGIVQDIEVYPERELIWIGFDATIEYHPSYFEEARSTVGGLRRLEALASTGIDLITTDCASDLKVRRLSADSGKHVIVYWSYSLFWDVPMGDPQNRGISGYAVFGVGGDTVSYVTLLEMFEYAGPAGVYVSYPIPDADMTGDGIPEAVYAYSAWQGVTYAKTATDVCTLAASVPLWSVDNWHKSSIWELDGDGLPDVLLHWASTAFGVKGSTGDTLFTLATTYRLYPWVTGSLAEDGVQRGVLVNKDSLVAYHLEFDPADVGDDRANRPVAFTLHPNYPNPFNASTRVTYELASPAEIRLSIFDVLGRHVRTLARGEAPAGEHSVRWDGKDKAGRAVASAVYLIRLSVGGEAQTRKVLLLR